MDWRSRCLPFLLFLSTLSSSFRLATQLFSKKNQCICLFELFRLESDPWRGRKEGLRAVGMGTWRKATKGSLSVFLMSSMPVVLRCSFLFHWFTQYTNDLVVCLGSSWVFSCHMIVLAFLNPCVISVNGLDNWNGLFQSFCMSSGWWFSKLASSPISNSTSTILGEQNCFRYE
jgi:hypothetical protein